MNKKSKYLKLFRLKLSKKQFLIGLSIIILLFIYGLCNLVSYISKVKIYEPVNITIDGLNDNEFNAVNIYGISPKNRILNLNKLIELHKWDYNYYRYYTAIKLSVPDSIIDKIKQISITIGKTNYIYDNAKFKHEWNKIKEESKTNMGYSIYELPENARGNTSVISALASGIYMGGDIKTVLIISLIIIIAILLYYNHTRLKSFLIKFPKNKRYRAILVLALIIIYYIIFSQKASFTDFTYFKEDCLIYQSIGVNFAKGHGIQKIGGIEKFKEYKFYSDIPYRNFTVKHFYEIGGYDFFFMTPGYTLFLGIIYKIFGVSPLIAKYIQLLLLIIVAAFLPLIGYYFWKFSGFISGLIASPLYIAFNYNISEGIMTESLVIFFIFLIVISFIYFKSKKNLLSSVILGIILGLSVLVKGTLIFIPFLFFLYLLIKFYKAKEKKILKSLLIIVTTFILTILPWSIYANIKIFHSIIAAKQIKTIISDNTLSVQDKANLLDSVSSTHKEINSNLFKLSKTALLDNRLSEESKDFFFDIFINDSFIILSSQGKSALLDGHNEFVVNSGKAEPEWRDDKNSFYNNDKMENASSIIRIINFYKHYPNLIPKLIKNKIVVSFSYFKFFWLILVIFIIESCGFVINKYFKNKLFYLFFVILTIPVFLLPFYYNVTNDNIIYIFLILIPPVIFTIINKAKHTVFKVPVIFYIIFLNFFLMTIIFYGFKRLIVVIDFIFILTSVYYLLEYIFITLKRLNINLGLKQ